MANTTVVTNNNHEVCWCWKSIFPLLFHLLWSFASLSMWLSPPHLPPSTLFFQSFNTIPSKHALVLEEWDTILTHAWRNDSDFARVLVRTLHSRLEVLGWLSIWLYQSITPKHFPWEAFNHDEDKSHSPKNTKALSWLTYELFAAAEFDFRSDPCPWIPWPPWSFGRPRYYLSWVVEESVWEGST